jgi:hypothetical protein
VHERFCCAGLDEPVTSLVVKPFNYSRLAFHVCFLIS